MRLSRTAKRVSVLPFRDVTRLIRGYPPVFVARTGASFVALRIWIFPIERLLGFANGYMLILNRDGNQQTSPRVRQNETLARPTRDFAPGLLRPFHEDRQPAPVKLSRVKMVGTAATARNAEGKR